MLSKKPAQIVSIGIATAIDIKKLLTYQMLKFLIPLIYNTLITIFKKPPLLPGEVNTNFETNLERDYDS